MSRFIEFDEPALLSSHYLFITLVFSLLYWANAVRTLTQIKVIQDFLNLPVVKEFRHCAGDALRGSDVLLQIDGAAGVLENLSPVPVGVHHIVVLLAVLRVLGVQGSLLHKTVVGRIPPTTVFNHLYTDVAHGALYHTPKPSIPCNESMPLLLNLDILDHIQYFLE